MDTLVILIYLVSLSVTQFIHNGFCHSYRLGWLGLGYVTNIQPSSTAMTVQCYTVRWSMNFAGTKKYISNGKMLLVLLGSFAHLVLQSHDMWGFSDFLLAMLAKNHWTFKKLTCHLTKPSIYEMFFCFEGPEKWMSQDAPLWYIYLSDPIKLNHSCTSIHWVNLGDASLLPRIFNHSWTQLHPKVTLEQRQNAIECDGSLVRDIQIHILLYPKNPWLSWDIWRMELDPLVPL